MSAWITAALWLALAVHGGAAVQENVDVTKPTRAAEINFELQRGFLVIVPAAIGGIRDLSFAVDTGSGRTIIDQRLARQLRLPEAPAQLAAVNRSIPAPESIAAAFEMGPVRIDSVPVLVRDLAFLRKLTGRHIDGILGLDVLSRQTFSVDYHRHKLLLGDCLAGEFHVSLVRTTSMLAVPVQIHGSVVNLLVDTGASEMQLYANKAAITGPLGERKAYSLAGAFKVDEVVLASLSMGSDELKSSHAFVVNDQADETQDFDGLLSPVALGISRMCVDMQRGEFSWSR